jgi:hypothetical protein
MRDTQSAFIWIVGILKDLNIPFQISGGLAARVYGATRDLQDIDIEIPESCFEIITEKVRDFITFGPAIWQDDHWDCLLVTLNYCGQEIDLSGAYKSKIFNAEKRKWQDLLTDYSRASPQSIFNTSVPVISKEDLTKYKKILSRPVDVLDIQELTKA